MLLRTHFVIGVFFILMLSQFFKISILFFVVFLIATLLPDIDSRFSRIGKKKILRPLQFMSGHRKFIHSFGFLTLVCLIFLTFSVHFAIFFFLGYSLHLLLDSFTILGIYPFYPIKLRIHGFVKTGKVFEFILFVFFIFLNVWLFLYLFYIL